MNPIHYTKIKDWHWPSFSPKEIACKGDGMILIDEHSMDCLQMFRDMVGVPVILNSAYRSPEYNKQIGGAPKSQHLFGKAFDVRITDKLPRERIHEAAMKCGFTGFGDYNTFVHIDTGPIRSWDLRG
jgi:zinc D-Ala-D-Ala carboxypeptidase